MGNRSTAKRENVGTARKGTLLWKEPRNVNPTNGHQLKSSGPASRMNGKRFFVQGCSLNAQGCSKAIITLTRPERDADSHRSRRVLGRVAAVGTVTHV